MKLVVSKISRAKLVNIATTIASDNYNTFVALNNRGEIPGIVESIKMIPYDFIGQFIPKDILEEGKKKHAEFLEKIYSAMEELGKDGKCRISRYTN